jgi:hypothetical protein
MYLLPVSDASGQKSMCILKKKKDGKNQKKKKEY